MIQLLTLSLGLAVTVLSAAKAQHFSNLDTKVVDTNLQQLHKQDGWYAYSVPAAEDTASMCCFNKGKQAACDLNETSYGYGSNSQSPDTANINVFVHVDAGQVNRMMPVGDHCEVKAAGITVDWLNDVTEQQSIDWLQQQVVDSRDGDENGGLYVLSLHASDQAARALSEMAADDAGEYSEQSVFWLGQRQKDGFDYLQMLYEKLPVGDTKRKINFALSQHRSTESVALLKNIAQHDQDDEQQADAIFWLSQTDDVADLPVFLIDLMSTTESDEIKDKAVFSLSQIDNTEANHELANLVKDHKDAEVREKALFWLAQNDPKLAKDAAINLLKIGQHTQEQENAVFVLSQLPSKQSSQALFDIIKGDYSRNIKKKALFWLSQSEDQEILSQLEDLL